MNKRNKIVDPFAEREALKYACPVPSREYILEYLSSNTQPIKYKEICATFGLESAEEQEGLRRRLRAMERDGQLVFSPKQGYVPADKLELITGRVVGHREGYGFVLPDEGGEPLFLNARQMRVLFPQDRVQVRVIGLDHRGRREAALVQILERNTQQVIGRLVIEGEVGFVLPSNHQIVQNIVVPPEHRGNAKAGQIVIVAITQQPTAYHQAIGKIIAILGEHMAAGMEIDIAAHVYQLPQTWPAELLEEIKHIDPHIGLEGGASHRLDLTELPFVTIDGEDAKDFDDAVYCEKKPRGGFTLYVAIADVSHYVAVDTALDQEALLRGNSVYFPGRVIPMLPEVLSNELCSLKPNVPRFCLVCKASINAQGKVARYQFYEALIHSAARLTYDETAALLQTKPDQPLTGRAAQLLPHLRALQALYHVLRQARDQRGAIEFEMTETKVVFGAGRKIEQIVPVMRNEAHKIIEECMLVANVAAAQFLSKHKMPLLYRVHPTPNATKLTEVRRFLGELGVFLGGEEQPEPMDYARLLHSIQARKDAHLIQTVLLRSLSQAQYSPINVGHFGLAYPLYAHFTSPIRRYPDLLVHRAIRHVLRGGSTKNFFYDKARMVHYGERCSMTERRADEATRDAMAWLKCEYMLDQVGSVFPGIITAVTGFGLFVELQDIYVEGLVHIASLKNDYYHFDALRYRLTGERSGKAYRLGDKVEVQVVRVNLDDKKIDFELVDNKGKNNSKSKGKGAGKGNSKQPHKAKAKATKIDKKAQNKPKKAKKSTRKRRQRS